MEGGGEQPPPPGAALTQAHVEHILHGLAGLCVEDAPAHAQPDDGHLGDHAAQQDAQVAAAVVHQVQGAGLVRVVDQTEEHHRQDHKPGEMHVSQGARESRCLPWTLASRTRQVEGLHCFGLRTTIHLASEDMGGQGQGHEGREPSCWPWGDSGGSPAR